MLRLFTSYFWQVPFFHPKYFLYRFYTNLQQQQNYVYKPQQSNLLILGGSTLYADTIRFTYRETNYVINFCSVCKQEKDKLNINGLSLAYPANTIMDCLYEYRFVGDKKFDYVLLYNGINDTRANNIATEKFNSSYRHIEFYDDLAIYERHPEINIMVFPFVVDWTAHVLSKKLFNPDYLPKENLHTLRTAEGRKEFLQYGGEIKTAPVFKKTLEEIKNTADARKQKLILSSLAWYQPVDYTYENFTAKKFDYVQSLFPTELYGEPDNVIKGINLHNQIMREFASAHPDVVFVDAEKLIPKEGRYFNDICHFSDEGCAIFADSIAGVLKALQKP